jgi:2-polyprenyl-3-methyl-5-hydroxy-6-metoxy-1,4-benzoquinol methylase
MDYSKRTSERELMDLGPEHYTEAEYEQCLYQLDRIGSYLGGDKASYETFGLMKSAPRSILDVGCGGGLFTIKLAKRFPNARVIGSDISKEAITFANKQLENLKVPLSNVEFIQQLKPEIPNIPKIDVITATLMCHHLTDNEVVRFLKSAYELAQKAVIINDLHRNPVAYYSFTAIAPLLFRNKLVLNDGPISILRGFSKQEWINYLKEANIPLKNCKLTWHWAFRWMLFINKER